MRRWVTSAIWFARFHVRVAGQRERPGPARMMTMGAAVIEDGRNVPIERECASRAPDRFAVWERVREARNHGHRHSRNKGACDQQGDAVRRQSG
jgi:hypothetical protein